MIIQLYEGERCADNIFVNRSIHITLRSPESESQRSLDVG
jgi:hypothetical protein